MNGFRKSFAVISLCVLTLFVVGSSVYAKGAIPKRLEIFNATVDWDNKTITINGENFGSSPQIWLNSYDLTEGATTSHTKIIANLPNDPQIDSGTYRLFVSRRGFRPDHPEKTDIMDITIGAVVGPEGPPGPKGARGDRGDAGEKGGPGYDGIRCWDRDADSSCDIIWYCDYGICYVPPSNEDSNLDNKCDISDCEGDRGERGANTLRFESGWITVPPGWTKRLTVMCAEGETGWHAISAGYEKGWSGRS